ncbi:MAG TPA: hypothetical protein VFO39_05900 [Candidatus Sulfotelmatobacter sp.]|nr:hypothetical protein [Candidatus Sulfotelmatobacter sp.]
MTRRGDGKFFHGAIVVGTLLGLALVLSGCGSSNHNNINGNWTAALTNPDGSPAFSFTTSLTASGSSGINVTNLTFTTQNPCFSGTVNATGGFTVSGTFSGVTGGGFQMTLSSSTSDSKLVLTGTLNNNNSVSGKWMLTGSTSGCTGNGNFTMNKM